MNSNNQINIHDTISIEIDTNFPWRKTWIDNIADVIAVSPSPKKEPLATLKLVYKNSLLSANMRELSPGIYIEKSALLDRRYNIRLESPLKNTLVLQTDNPALEWLSWGLQLTFLMANMACIHCATIEKGGKAVIFPSWGGVGKTALLTAFVKSMDWQLLGDDLVVLSPDGVCYGFPRPMVLYPYHKEVFPEVFSSGRGPVAPTIMNRWLTKMAIQVKPLLRTFPNALQFARKHNPQAVRINPSEVFGIDKLSQKAQAKVVVWLDRVQGLTEPEFLPANGTVVSRIIGSTLKEYDPWCVNLTNVAMGLGIIDIDQVYSTWTKIIKEGLAECETYILYLPADLPVTEVPKVVQSIFAEHSVWN